MDYDHFEYGRMLSRRLRPVAESADGKKYYTCSESENLYDLSVQLSSARGLVMVAVDGCNSDFEMNRGDALLEVPQYYFLFLQQAQTDVPADILAKQRGCKAICRQVQGYMLREMADPLRVTAMKCLVPNSFTIRGAGPIGDNFYGAALGFTLKLNVEWTEDEGYWTD